MPISYEHMRAFLKQMQLQDLFIAELNWNRPQSREFQVAVHAGEFRLKPLAEQGGVQVLEVKATDGTGIPDRATRQAIESKVTEHAYEHLLVFTEPSNTTAVWNWTEREKGKRVASFDHRFNVQQSGDSLIAKLAGLAFDMDELDDEGRASLTEAQRRVQAAFHADRVTKRFYDEFQRQHDAFLAFIAGIESQDDGRWYASVMLNRLMFIYFIQKKGFLDTNVNYLRDRLQHCQREGLPYYRGFLVHLFFEGFAARPDERNPETNRLLGQVPYLNGGLFLPHQIEQAHDGIDIPDEAFELVFEFFERYHWHLDDRPLHDDDEINPDVLGYIFEKYINQKQMGAYYTKEDITGYIARNTVLPFLFDRLKHFCYEALTPLPIGCADARACPADTQTEAAIDRYIYDAVKKGVELDLPDYIAAGLDDVAKRTRWNERADDTFANPTETWREHVARRRRYEQIVADFQAGKIADINDFITYNLDIVQYAHDFLADTQDPRVIQTFYFECLTQVTILDPTCGSGAFLFAALNLLEPLYELCLERMEDFLARKKRHPQWAQPFEQELARVEEHPSRPYFIYKSIIVNNLFGVDIMDEAVEIAKLRLFLKLVAQVEDVDHIEPLPDIDFNIRAGNTLVGYATLEEIERSKAPGDTSTAAFDFGGIVDRVKSVDRELRAFRQSQNDFRLKSQDYRETKANLQTKLQQVEEELNRDLAFQRGYSTPQEITTFVNSHKPFHWYLDFYDIMQHGGFDVIIGNPPYVEYRKVRDEYTISGYATESCGDLYAFTVERSTAHLVGHGGRVGMIVPVSSLSTGGFQPLRHLLRASLRPLWCSSYAERPSKLFEGAEKRLSIVLVGPALTTEAPVWSAKYHRWMAEERPELFPKVQYASLSWVDVDLIGALEGSIPKIGTDTEGRLLRTIGARSSSIGDSLAHSAGHVVLYTRKLRYFVQFFDFAPELRDAHGKRRDPSELKSFSFPTAPEARAALSALNSSLFFWFLVAASDCRNLNRREILAFPLDLAHIPPQEDKALTALSQDLMRDFQQNSSMVTANYETGPLRIQTFQPRLSKPIIDEIDRVLAEHYGLTDEELDFIINYDIKYRMGGAEPEDDSAREER
jgi:hypothetical protein